MVVVVVSVVVVEVVVISSLPSSLESAKPVTITVVAARLQTTSTNAVGSSSTYAGLHVNVLLPLLLLLPTEFKVVLFVSMTDTFCAMRMFVQTLQPDTSRPINRTVPMAVFTANVSDHVGAASCSVSAQTSCKSSLLSDVVSSTASCAFICACTELSVTEKMTLVSSKMLEVRFVSNRPK